MQASLAYASSEGTLEAIRYELVRREFNAPRLDGRNMRTWPELYNEVAAACQFPLYFGKNYAALFDLLTDFEWAPSPAAYCLCIAHPGLVLESEAANELKLFVDLLRDAAEQWREELPRWDIWGRPMPSADFGAVLHAGVDKLHAFERWEAAGVTVLPLSQMLGE